MRVFIQILLVIVLGIVERFGGGDLGGDVTGIVRVVHRRLEAREAGLCRLRLFRGQRVNRRAVLGAVIVTLPHTLRRVVIFPEHLQ